MIYGGRFGSEMKLPDVYGRTLIVLLYGFSKLSVISLDQVRSTIIGLHEMVGSEFYCPFWIAILVVWTS